MFLYVICRQISLTFSGRYLYFSDRKFVILPHIYMKKERNKHEKDKHFAAFSPALCEQYGTDKTKF